MFWLWLYKVAGRDMHRHLADAAPDLSTMSQQFVWVSRVNGLIMLPGDATLPSDIFGPKRHDESPSEQAEQQLETLRGINRSDWNALSATTIGLLLYLPRVAGFAYNSPVLAARSH